MATLDTRVWCTLEDLKENLDIEDTDTSKDSYLTNLLNACWESCKNYIGHDLNQDEYTEYHSGDGTNAILLKKYPVVSITTLHDDITRAFDTDTLIDPVNYTFDDQTGLVSVYTGTVFTKGTRNIQVVYIAGYETIPYDAQRALILMASWFAGRQGTDGKTNETLGGKSQAYDMFSIPLYIRQLLVSYKDFTV
jgi:hypothetical protein